MPRNLVHVLVGLGFWVLFALLWVDVVRDGKAAPDALTLTAVQLGAVAAVVLLVTAAWVHHNVAIYRRLGARPGRATVAPDTTRDRLGRPVSWVLPGGAAAAVIAPHLVVDVADGVKVYAAPAGPGDAAPAAGPAPATAGARS